MLGPGGWEPGELIGRVRGFGLVGEHHAVVSSGPSLCRNASGAFDFLPVVSDKGTTAFPLPFLRQKSIAEEQGHRGCLCLRSRPPEPKAFCFVLAVAVGKLAFKNQNEIKKSPLALPPRSLLAISSPRRELFRRRQVDVVVGNSIFEFESNFILDTCSVFRVLFLSCVPREHQNFQFRLRFFPFFSCTCSRQG